MSKSEGHSPAGARERALDLMLRGYISERIYVSYPAERPQRK